VAQPDYVPIVSTDRVRPSNRLQPPDRWVQDRPAEILSMRQPEGPSFGAAGSDLGFGLKLANLVAERAVLTEGEHRGDVVAGCFSSGTRRSSFFHRSPVIYDMEWAFTLWGFMEGAPADLVAFRQPLFAGAAHDYSRQRAIAGMLPERVIRMGPAEVKADLSKWRDWLEADKTSS
jgi:hypothetical protein